MTAPSNKLVIKWFSSTISSAYHGIAWKPKSKSIKQCKNTAICRNLPNLIQLNCVFPPKILTTNAWQPRFVADVHVSEGLQNWVPSRPGSPPIFMIPMARVVGNGSPTLASTDSTTLLSTTLVVSSCRLEVATGSTVTLEKYWCYLYSKWWCSGTGRTWNDMLAPYPFKSEAKQLYFEKV